MAAPAPSIDAPRAGPSKLSHRKASRQAAPQAKGASGRKTSKRPPVGRLLGSSDKEVRETAVEDLLDFLAGSQAEEGLSREEESEQQEQHKSNDVDDEGAINEEHWESVKLPKTFRDEQMMILWQGCFYCMYMCDKPFPQQKLAGQLAEPVLSIASNPQLKSKTARAKAAITYLSTFWITMVRELPNIDKYRMDKYYTLMRRMLCASFRLMQRMKWNGKVMAEVLDILTREGGPLRLQDVRTPISVAYHIIDIYLDELEKAMASEDDARAELEPESESETAQAETDGTQDAKDKSSPAPAPLLDLLQPFIDVLTQINVKTHFQRVLENVFDPLIDALQSQKKGSKQDGENNDEKRDEEEEDEPSSKRRRVESSPSSPYPHLLRDQPADLDAQVLKRLFEHGAKETTDDVNRKRLYSYATRKGYEGDE